MVPFLDSFLCLAVKLTVHSRREPHAYKACIRNFTYYTSVVSVTQHGGGTVWIMINHGAGRQENEWAFWLWSITPTPTPIYPFQDLQKSQGEKKEICLKTEKSHAWDLDPDFDVCLLNSLAFIITNSTKPEQNNYYP